MVLLRDFDYRDINPLITILNDEAVTRFLSTKIPSPYTKEDAKWWVEEGSKTGIVKAISLNNKLVGCIGVNPGQFEYELSGEVGYWLDKHYWGKGIASDALSQMVNIVFTSTDLIRLFATVFEDNIASQKLLVKAGFTREAILKSAIYKQRKLYDSHIFAKIKTP
ncbi:N-acetyltransferase [Alteromonas sediminis]|uniref:N-acetyltransferase n=1 Tax=Alteromonas sediminis TaxID=2259342 RepID=A0A3N5YNI6_9ALTE|nr:GNAT family protein [Alteromonas sediminis]RPJ67191.1 N-acetyltransferase [Alteromonas sediminis]